MRTAAASRPRQPARSRTRWLAWVAAAGLLGGVSAAAIPAGFPDLQAGERLALQKGCANCHGILGPGGREGPDLLSVARGRGATEILAGMWNHVPQMTAALLARERLPGLSGVEMRDLVGYLSFVNYLGDTGDAHRGETMVASMSCLACHDLQQKGRVGPALFSSTRSASPVGLVTDVWNHYPGMSRALRARGMNWFPWSGGMVTDVSHYLRSLAPAGAPLALQEPGDPRDGAGLFASLGCRGCHAPDRAEAWKTFVRGTNRHSAAENGAAMLAHLPTLGDGAGRGSRPLRPLSEKQMADLLAYLGFAGTDLPGGDAARGRQVFENKRCIRCHALAGSPPGIGPDVAKMPAIPDPYSAAALMFDHARDMKTATELKHVPWPRMQPDELLDLYAFLSLERRP